MPVAVTEKEAVCPTVTSALTGGVVIDGGEGAPLTLALLVGPPPPASATHPERERLPSRTTRRKRTYF